MLASMTLAQYNVGQSWVGVVVKRYGAMGGMMKHVGEVVIAVLVMCTPVVSAEMGKEYGSTNQATATDKMKTGTSQTPSSQVATPASATTKLPDNGSYDLAKQTKPSTAAHHAKHTSTAKHHEPSHPHHTASAGAKAKHPHASHTTHTSSAGTH